MRNKVSFAIDHSGMLFIHQRTGQPFSGAVTQAWFCCTVYSPTGEVIAAALGEFKTAFEIHFTAAIDNPRAITRRLLRTIFETLFARAVRVVCLVDPENDHSGDIVRRLGFQYAGFARKGLDGIRDACIFDMLREDCPWLPGYAGGTIRYVDFGGEPLRIH